GNLHATGAGRIELRERRVARAEVHLLVGDGGDAAAGADRAVVELEAELVLDRALPLRHERSDEGAACAVDICAATLGGRRTRRAHREGCGRRSRGNDEGDANELAVARHLLFLLLRCSLATYGGAR